MNWTRVMKISISCIIAFIYLSACSKNTSQSTDLVLEMSGDGRMQVIRVPINELGKVGINERSGGIRVEIVLPQQYHTKLESITREMVGGNMVIKLRDETVSSGKIFEPLSQGRFSFDVPSEKEALSLFDRMGMKPSYHLRVSHEEVEASKRNAEILSSPMIKKAFEALTVRKDLETAINYARKAVESEPSEPAYREILSTFYYQQGNKQMALDEMLTAERLSSSEDLKRYPGILLSIANLYVGFKEYAKAKEYISRVLSDDPNNFLAHLDLAELYEKMGELDLAIRQYLVISKSPDVAFQAKGTEGLDRLQKK